MIIIEAGFWRRQFVGLLEAEWGQKEKVARYLMGKTRGQGQVLCRERGV